ncbi:uncharacterized protein [Branchiostoma lanceolatum]|uniref:uncharacterized protein isoform X1 n=1 Tax=Branchiostoma lanceolatum TaxID=7740 RepID=UPI0034533F43
MSQRSGKSSMKSTTSFPYSTAELRKQRKQRKQRANGVTATAGEVDNLSSSVQTLDLNSDSTSMAISSSLGQLDTLSWYVRCLHHDRRWFPLTKDNTYAIADCDPNGQLKRGFQLVQGKAFESASGERHVLYLCSCDDAREQNDRLSATANVLAGEDLGTFAVREEGLYCLHARAAERIIPPLITEQEEEEANENGVVEQLQTDPFLAAVHDGKTYGILKRRDCGKLCCVSCSSRQMSCTHVAKYKEWCEDRGVDSNNVFADSSEANFESVSKSPVPYPWTKEMREQFGRYESHTDNFPLNLVPDLPAEGCEHGHDWDPRDPVTQQWTQHVGVCIYTRYANINYYPAPDGQRLPRVVYYRPTVGDCGCRHHYDGAADLLHNIDNRKMIYYGLLVDHLHSMVEGRQPLRTTQRVCNRTRATCGPLNEF